MCLWCVNWYSHIEKLLGSIFWNQHIPFSIQCVSVLSHSVVSSSFHPHGLQCSPLGSSCPIFQARKLGCIAISFPRGSSGPGLKLHLLRLLHRQADSLPLHHLGSHGQGRYGKGNCPPVYQKTGIIHVVCAPSSTFFFFFSTFHNSPQLESTSSWVEEWKCMVNSCRETVYSNMSNLQAHEQYE